MTARAPAGLERLPIELVAFAGSVSPRVLLRLSPPAQAARARVYVSVYARAHLCVPTLRDRSRPP